MSLRMEIISSITMIVSAIVVAVAVERVKKK